MLQQDCRGARNARFVAATIGLTVFIVCQGFVPARAADDPPEPALRPVPTVISIQGKDAQAVDGIIACLRADLQGPDAAPQVFVLRVQDDVVAYALPSQLVTIQNALAKAPQAGPAPGPAPPVQGMLVRDEWRLGGRDPAQVDGAVSALMGRLRPGTDMLGFYLVRVGDVVLMRGCPEELAAVKAALDLLPVASTAPPAISFIDVRGKDPAQVAAAVRALQDRTEPAEGTPEPLFLQVGDQVIMSGSPRDLALAQQVLGALQELPRLEQRTYGLCVLADSPAVQGCLTQAKVTIYQSRGCELQVRASRKALDELAALLSERRLIGLPASELVRLRYFRDPVAAVCLLHTSRERLAPDVAITPFGSEKQRAALILCGPREQVDALRRRIAYADVSLPQVRLDLWSVQLSGSNATQVQEKAAQAQASIARTDQLIEDYLRMLEMYAAKVWGQARDPSTLTTTDADQTITDYRGPVNCLPMILTAMYVGVPTTTNANGGPDVTTCVLPPDGLRDRYGEWIAALTGAPLSTNEVSMRLQPQALHRVIATRRREGGALADLLALAPALRNDVEFEKIAPERIATTFAAAQADLDACEEALVSDIRRIFLVPLRDGLRRKLRGAISSGLASCGEASLTVLSGSEATVVGSAVSYFEVTQEPKLDATAIETASGIATNLATVFRPSTAAGSPAQWSSRVHLLDPSKATEWTTVLKTAYAGLAVGPVDGGLFLLGSQREVEGAIAALRTAGVIAGEKTGVTPGSPPRLSEVAGATSATMPSVSGLGEFLGSASGIPLDSLLSLGLALSPPERVWSAMTEGATLTFTPIVAPGGTLAEINVHATVTHDDPGSEQATAGAKSSLPLSCVAKHEATTKFNLQPLDLFEVTTFGLRTTHPRADYVVPIIGQIPYLGRMFQFPRSPRQVQHESILLVHSTISPTVTDLLELLAGAPDRQ